MIRIRPIEVIVGLLLACGAASAGPAKSTSTIKSLNYGKYVGFFGSATGYQGNVDYAWIKAHRAPLDTFVSDIARLDKAAYESWPEKERMAFWINVYNALAARVVIDRYPLRGSALRANREGRRPGSVRRGIEGTRFKVMDREVTLPDIRDRILRKEFGDPRVHFVLVEAANGYPPLPSFAYSGQTLDTWLEFQTARMLHDSTFLRIDTLNGTVWLSPLLQWYSADFVQRYGTKEHFGKHTEAERAVLNFVARNIGTGWAREYLLTREYTIRYNAFDWSLNDAIEPVKRL